MQSAALLNLRWTTFVIAGQVLQMSVEKFGQSPGLGDSSEPDWSTISKHRGASHTTQNWIWSGSCDYICTYIWAGDTWTRARLRVINFKK